jgi:hypothetical protein
LTIAQVEAHIDKPWNWEHLSKNPNITLMDITSTPNHPWYIQYVLSNPTVTLNDLPALQPLIDIAEFTEFDIYSNFSTNPSIPIEYAIATINIFPWDWFALTRHPSVTIDFINASSPDIPWCLKQLSSNRTLTTAFIRSKNDFENSFCWLNISNNPAFTNKDVRNNLDFPWSIVMLTQKGKLDLKVLLCEDNILFNMTIREKFMYNLQNDPQIEYMYWYLLSKAPLRLNQCYTIQRTWKQAYIRRRMNYIVTLCHILRSKLGCPYISREIILSYILV